MTVPAVALLKKLQACLHKEFNCSSSSSMLWSGSIYFNTTLKRGSFCCGTEKLHKPF